MTRDEFIQGVVTWEDLRGFCWEEDCDIGDCIYTSNQRDEALDEDVMDLARELGWKDLYDTLSAWEAESGYDYYLYNDGVFEPARESDFRDLKEEVLDWMDDNGLWDEDDAEDGFVMEDNGGVLDGSAAEDAEDFDIPDEEFSVSEMITASFGCLVELDKAERLAAEEDDKAFFNLIV